MKVCMITFQYPPMFNGGVATVSYRLAKNLAAHGVEMHVVAPGAHLIEERIFPTFEEDVVVHRTFPALGTYFGDHAELGRIADYIIALHGEVNFDLVHALFVVPAGQIGAVLSGQIDLPLVVSIHGSDIELMRYNPVLSPTVRWILENASEVTAVSSDLLDKAQRFAGITKGWVIPNAVDPRSFDSLSVRELAANHGWRFQVIVESCIRAKRRGGPVVGTVGMVRPAKGFSFLLRAFHKLVQKFPRAHLLIVGDFMNPDEKKRVFDEIKAKGLRRKVSLVGFVPASQVAAWLREMDIFVLPSLHEGSPCALMEAMACGLSVIATDIGGIPDIITDGVHGLLVPPSDSEVLAEKIIALIDDNTMRTRLGTAAKQRMECEFSPEIEINKWMDVYVSVKKGTQTSVQILH